MKAPAFQFYVMDWSTDLEDHPLEIEGAWIRICCKLWRSEKKGELSKTVIQWSRILRVDLKKTKEILEYISHEKIANVSPCYILEIENNQKITVVSRRMERERISKDKNRLRQDKYRLKKKSNAKSNKKITPPTSSSSSTSSSSVIKTDQKVGKNFLNLGGTYLDEIINKCRIIQDLQADSRGDKKINIGAWVNQSVKGGAHPKAIDYSIEQLIKKWDVVGSPWPYIQSIFEMSNGNFWEADHTREAEKFKIEWESIDDKIKGLIEQINNGGDKK